MTTMFQLDRRELERTMLSGRSFLAGAAALAATTARAKALDARPSELNIVFSGFQAWPNGGQSAALAPGVGYRLTEEALVFGGSTLTATDVAVAAGVVDVGDRARVANLRKDLVKSVLGRARQLIEIHADRIKTQAGDFVLLAVGGGAFLIPDRLEGVSRVVRVEHGGCANAVGAAIAQVSGEVDQVYQGLERAEAIARARLLAEQRAVDAGADAKGLSLVEAEDIPIAYLPGNALRIRVKVVGNIAPAPTSVKEIE
jgi:hypothetical protein